MTNRDSSNQQSPTLIHQAELSVRTRFTFFRVVRGFMNDNGMSTGVTASGLMLLRIIDKDLDSGAAEDYALAAPLSSPFVGGGVFTVLLFPYMLQQLGVGPTALIVLAVTAGLYGVGLLLADR